MQDDFSQSDLKTVMVSKRANLFYLEHCRLAVSGGTVNYITEAGNKSLYFNIPIANTTFILLGAGTSITQAAARYLARAGVCFGFCGSGGTPLYSSNETEYAISWITPQSEYRATEYLQMWCSFWFDDRKRLEAAKLFQKRRIAFILKMWPLHNAKRGTAFDLGKLSAVASQFSEGMARCGNVTDLLTLEGRVTKDLYAVAASGVEYGAFSRVKNGEGKDPANRMLDYGNYLAYGLAACTAWTLGLPYGLSVMHGKTRRGGLVFDIADIVKDAIVLPLAFEGAMRGFSEEEFRIFLQNAFVDCQTLDYMIDTVEQAARAISGEAKL